MEQNFGPHMEQQPRLAELRKSRGLTQTELGDQVGVSYRLRDGRAIEDLVSEPIPDRFGEWAHPDFFALNLRLLHERADASSGG